jgi:hypothetical protein
VNDARDLVRELFPQARWAVVGGSVVTPARTAGSDLDIVVFLPDDDPASPARDTRRFRGWPVELFTHDRKTLDHYLDKDLARRQPALQRMLAVGVPLLGPDEDLDEVQARCRAVLAEGPGPLGPDELAAARYGLTDLVDDLVHSTDPGETAVITARAWEQTAQLALDVAGHWRGGGKWMVRELRDLDPGVRPPVAARPAPATGGPRAGRGGAALGRRTAVRGVPRAGHPPLRSMGHSPHVPPSPGE